MQPKDYDDQKPDFDLEYPEDRNTHGCVHIAAAFIVAGLIAAIFFAF